MARALERPLHDDPRADITRAGRGIPIQKMPRITCDYHFFIFSMYSVLAHIHLHPQNHEIAVVSESNSIETVSDAIAAFQRGELPQELLLWNIVCCETFIVPVIKDDEGTHIRTFDGGHGAPKQIIAFSEPEALEAARASGEAKGLDADVVVISSDTLLSFVDRDEALVLNPHTEHALTFQPGQAESIREAGRMSGVERALSMSRRPPLDPNALRAIASHDGFHVVLRNENRLDLAPDAQDRALLAAFTSEEALHEYLGKVTELTLKHGTPRVLTLSGIELAEKLTHLDIIGVVFNCAGPLTPLALSRQLGEHILHSVNDGV